MKTLIVYYSQSGNCEYIADQLKEALKADTLGIKPVEAYPDSGAKKFLWGGKAAIMAEKPVLEEYQFDGDKYDLIIFGFPVWASNITPPIRTFIDDNREALKDKKLACFVCLSGMGGDKALTKAKEFLNIDKFEARAKFIDPLTRNKQENQKELESFIQELKNGPLRVNIIGQ